MPSQEVQIWRHNHKNIKISRLSKCTFNASSTLRTAKYPITTAVVAAVPKHLTARTNHAPAGYLRLAARNFVGMELAECVSVRSSSRIQSKHRLSKTTREILEMGIRMEKHGLGYVFRYI
jgi:hypothetical protein